MIWVVINVSDKPAVSIFSVEVTAEAQISYVEPVEESCQGRKKTGLGKGNETEPRISQ